jgi:Spy/CpxP family protein refolding chaperone
MISSRSLRIALCLALLFAAGAFAGSTFTHAKDRRWLAKQNLLLQSAEDSWLQRLHDRYAADLGMTEAQITQVKPAMEKARQQFRSVREDASQRARQIMNELYHSVQTELTPEQQARFARLVKDRHTQRPQENSTPR